MSSRGIRNNNPGNIKDFGVPWEGLASRQEMTEEQRREKIFCVFRKPWWGIRAMARTLLTYQSKYNLNTLEKIIQRWAPSADNNPEQAYVDFVSAQVGVPADRHVSLRDFRYMHRLCEAIIQFENGENPYTWEVTTALILAGVEP